MSIKKSVLSVSALGLGLLGMACSSTAEKDTAAGPSASANGESDNSSTGGGNNQSDGQQSTNDSSTGGGNTGDGGAGNSGGSSENGTGETPITDGVVVTGGSIGNGDNTGGEEGSADPTVVVPPPSLITSGQGNFWQIGQVTEGGGAATVTVDDAQTFQAWQGFGGTFNERGWDALEELSAEDRALAIQLLFSSQNGLALTVGRIPIGSSDYGLDRYSLADEPQDLAGDPMQNFSIDRDQNDLIPYIKAALEVNPDIKFWASPWSPPPWMTDNGIDVGLPAPSPGPAEFDMDGRAMKSDPLMLQAHAEYLARFVEAYTAEGIAVEAVHPQNEPGWAQNYPSCAWPNNLLTTYIRDYLGPLFETRLPNTEIWLGTMSNTTSDSIVVDVMGDPAAAAYVKGIGLQWGMGDGNNPVTYQTYDVPVMQTEHKCGNYPWLGSYVEVAPNDYAYAEESWDLFTNWLEKGVNSYMAWNMVLDTSGRSMDTTRPWGQNTLLTVDRNSDSLIVTPTYFVFRHLSQYVKPGAVRVAVDGDALAFKNADGSIVTILHNGGGAPAATTLAVGGTTVQFEVPSRGWATVNTPAPVAAQ